MDVGGPINSEEVVDTVQSDPPATTDDVLCNETYPIFDALHPIVLIWNLYLEGWK